MKAVQIIEPGRVALAELPQPVCGPGEVLIRLDYVGFCGSDLNTFRGRNSFVEFPRIPGHEIGATVVAIGDGVPEGLTSGQTVTVNPYSNCGRCASCRRGRPNACENNETLGVQRDGAMKEYIALPWQKIIPCGGISPRDAAIIEPMSVGFHAIDRGRVTDSDVVMVIGCGMVGLGAVVRAVLRGATVIAADIDEEKLELARKLGAKYTYDTSKPWPEEIPAPDVVVEAVGATPTYRLAVQSVAFTGRIVCIGYAPSEVPLPTGMFVKKELDIMGSRNANPSDFEAVIKYLEGGAPVESFISGIIAPEEAEAALNAWAADPGKVFRILVKF